MTEFPENAIYCIESPVGKHNFIKEEGFTDFTCEYCFLPKDKANYKPMEKLDNGKFRLFEVKEQ